MRLKLFLSTFLVLVAFVVKVTTTDQVLQQLGVNFTNTTGDNDSNSSNFSSSASLLPPVTLTTVPTVIATPSDIFADLKSTNNESTTSTVTFAAADVTNRTTVTTRVVETSTRPLTTSNQKATTKPPPALAAVIFIKSAPLGVEMQPPQIRPKSANGDDQVTTPNGTNVEPTSEGTTAAGQKEKGSLLVLPKWSYEEMGDWGKVSQVCGQGSKQSPVALSLEVAYTARNFATDPLLFKNYDLKNFTGNLTNNGHVLVWTIDSASPTLPTIKGSGYGSAVFALDHLSFHWGAENLDSSCKGSEHVVDYNPAPLEVHFVHRNLKYQTYDEAQFKSDGLASISFLFRVVDALSNGTMTSYLDIVNALPDVTMPNATIELGIDLATKLPDFVSSPRSVFYRYDGSQTAPPCFESVSWTVYQDRIAIPYNQLQAFRRSLQIKAPSWSNKPFQTMENNFRPIQMRNSRTVWTNGRGYASGTTGNTNMLTTASTPYFLFLALAFILL